MYNHKRIFGIIMVSIMIFGMLGTSSAEPSSWAEDFMISMLMEDLSSDALLDPDLMQQPITREEFAELTVRLYAKAKNIEIESIPQWNPFADTDNPMVARAYNIGIVSGTGMDDRNRRLFSPKKQVTRQEIAVMLVKELRYLGVNVTPSYDKMFTDDATISGWAYDAVAFSAETGIISGVGNNMVAPKSNATREQAMTIINKIALKYGYIDGSGTVSKFNYGNAIKSNGFWLPIKDTQLRALTTDNGVKFVVSHLVDSYVVDIEGQQSDVMNILVNSDAVSYTALLSLRDMLSVSYDAIAKKYIPQETVFVNLSTGAITSTKIGPSIKFSVDTEITLEYIK